MEYIHIHYHMLLTDEYGIKHLVLSGTTVKMCPMFAALISIALENVLVFLFTRVIKPAFLFDARFE